MDKAKEKKLSHASQDRVPPIEKGLQVTNRQMIILLIAGILFLNAAFDGTLVWALRQSRTRYETSAEKNVDNISKMLEENVLTVFREIDLTLQTIADRILKSPSLIRPGNRSFDSFLETQASRVHGILGVRVVDATGNITYATGNIAPLNVNVADRDHFTGVRDNPNAGLVIGEPVLGRVTHKWILILSRRLSCPDGSFCGEVHASIPLAEISHIFSTLDLGAHGVVSMWNKTMTLARYPEEVKGKNVIGIKKPSKQLKALLDANTEHAIYRATAPTDNVKKTYSINRIGEFPLWTIAGFAEQDYLEPWRHEVHVMELIALIFAVISVLLAWEIYRIWRINRVWMIGQLEKERMEASLLKSQRLESLGILAGGIAHDFNNLLTTILSNISLALYNLKEGRPASNQLRGAEHASLQAKNLAEQLLTFSKGGDPVMRTQSIVKTIQESAVFATRGSRTRCEFFIPDDLWFVNADEGQLSQVINNLVINADQAMPEGGVISLRAENFVHFSETSGLEPGRYVKVSVHDTGIGISKEHLPKIFDPYFTTKQQGSGLGLATTHSIILKHSGSIAVESKPGAGTTFTLYLPASDTPEPPRVIEDSDPKKGSGKILYMDDNEGLQAAARDALQTLGYSVVCVSDGARAIELYQEAMRDGARFDLVLVDLTIRGGMGGREMMSLLKTIDPSARAVVCSGYSNDPVMADFRRYGFIDLLSKPYNLDQLSETVQRAITNSCNSNRADETERADGTISFD